MNDFEIQNDAGLSQSQKNLVAKLSVDQINEIDKTILSIADTEFRKIAFIVGNVIGSLPARVDGIPDQYYSQRVAYLVSIGELESRGNIKTMIYSEVKRKVLT